MALLDTIAKNLVLSFPRSANSSLWKFFVFNFGTIFLTGLLAALVIGGYAGKKRKMIFWMPKKWLILLAAASLVFLCFSFFQLYHRTLNYLFLLVFLSVFIYWTLISGNRLGIKIASFLKRPGGLIMVSAFLFLAFIMYAFFLSSSINLAFSKEGLRKTYKSIFGRDPGDSEKKAFWGGTVGEETPSKTKKDEYWDE